MNKTPPLALRSNFKLLEIGTRIHYHHRAAIARHKKRHNVESTQRGWVLTDGILRNEMYRPNGDDPFGFDRTKEMFFDWPQSRTWYSNKINKTIMVWPEDGYGWIIGIIRKSIGVSTPGSGGYNSYYGEWDYEPGYHQTDMYVDLYVVKLFYEGKDYVLCPLWAVTEIKDA